MAQVVYSNQPTSVVTIQQPPPQTVVRQPNQTVTALHVPRHTQTVAIQQSPIVLNPAVPQYQVITLMYRMKFQTNLCRLITNTIKYFKTECMARSAEVIQLEI